MLNDLELIKTKVKELQKETTDKDKIVKKLQEINECFLQNYIIKINDLITIYPVEIEIYYYNPSINFKDANSYQNELQKGEEHFGALFFHRGRGKEEKCNISICSCGFDISLSLGNYFLSILIRSAYINKNIVSGSHRIIINNFLPNISDETIWKMKHRKKIESEEEKKKIQQTLKTLEKGKNKLEFIKKEKYELKHHRRISKNKYFKHNEVEKRKYDEYELNTFINDAEIIKEIYKDKHEEIKNNLKNKLNNKNLFNIN